MNPAASSVTSPRKREARSRITNGKVLVGNVDQRTAWVRRCRDLIELHVADLGGPASISTAEANLIRRAAVLSVELERMEQRFATTDAAARELEGYQRAASSLRRLLESLGLKRRGDAAPADGSRTAPTAPPWMADDL